MQFKTLGLALCALMLSACSDSSSTKNFTGTVRFATFHVDMAYDDSRGYFTLLEQTGDDQDPRLANLAAILQQTYQESQPDVLLLTGFSTSVTEGGVADETAVEQFQQNYLAKAQASDLKGLSFPYRYVASTNSGQFVPFDVNGDGKLALPDDAQGYGHFHGQNSFVLLSKYALDNEQARTFRQFKWSDVTGTAKPPLDNGNEMDEQAWQALSVMDTNFVDIAMRLPDGRQISLLLTQLANQQPGADALRSNWLQQRNGAQLDFIADYISDRKDGDYLVDDKGRRGGVNLGRPFVLMGNLNNDEDPFRLTVSTPWADTYEINSSAIRKVLSDSYLLGSNGRFNTDSLTPTSFGAEEYKMSVGSSHIHPQVWTSLSGMRFSYVLPHKDLHISASGVFWPALGEAGFEWLYQDSGEQDPSLSSHERMVWVDVDFGRSK
ncbi:endonuclease/exonuclease/phosphatase family protein [Ferrimonas balearica]|uniref:endonuclease/exonuclease/phosphatase family protein n=1 Tax=Ferrimonas balearica TaxID=44012 RepID=UPI001C993AF4|nr:endonuclease/exonuclease/phosphatase family protein [Ferrimonas balearica]MBY5923512.1 endonuclease/exonuclease/phosphatase family protein [Ferrimonas balearica]MBY5997939.1 endonuclease/exonuclease/phosphatase family protein [Ferrimonas balearica]